MKATGRKKSDHNGLMMQLENLNWGPKPFRVFNCWLEENSLRDSLLKDLEGGAKLGESNIQIVLKKIKLHIEN